MLPIDVVDLRVVTRRPAGAIAIHRTLEQPAACGGAGSAVRSASMSEAADAARKPAVFLLSPARLRGYARQRRALRILWARRRGAPIGEVFQLLSGLYFRGKLAYARRFARPPAEVPWIGSGVLVITANRGLVPAEARVTIEHLEAFAQTDIHHAERQFRGPLVRDAELLRRALGDDGKVVLLGSIAQAKYTAPLLEVFGERLLFPGDFVGRGDMSRGGLLLRAAEGAKELDYVPVKGATLRGRRPPKLEPRTRR